MKRRHNQFNLLVLSNLRGFTVTELLAAIAVIAVLGMLLFPAFRDFRVRSQGVHCMNSMRQLGSALLAYSADHNGWLPPGYPIRNGKVEAEQRQPGAPPQIGASNQGFGDLFPTYLKELPLCPSMRLTPKERERYQGREQARLRALGGSYAVNLIIQQYPLQRAFSQGRAHRTPFLLESTGSFTWSMVHQTQAITGVSGYGIAGRHHGGGDRLNFMFLDGHLELISRNDHRDIPESEKDFRRSKGNMDGYFGGSGDKGAKYVETSGLSNTDFDKEYPQHAPLR